MDAPGIGELWRTFEDFRTETRDQYKFVVRLLIGTLTSAVLANLAAATIVVVFR